MAIDSMNKKDPGVDAYIDAAAEFAKPILNHIRQLAHQGCPEVEETLKWSMPAFMYKGLLFGMAAFKEHVGIWFWNHELVIRRAAEKDGMGQFGRIRSVAELPPDKVLLGCIRKAMEVKDRGVKAPRRGGVKPGGARDLVMPDYFAAALERNKKAQANFEKFPYSHKKEYLGWVAEAKREGTRERRLQRAVTQIAEGKPQDVKERP